MDWFFIVTFVTATVSSPMTPPPGQRVPEANSVFVTNQVQEIARRAPSFAACQKMLNEWSHRSTIGSQTIVEKKCSKAPPQQVPKSGLDL